MTVIYASLTVILLTTINFHCTITCFPRHLKPIQTITEQKYDSELFSVVWNSPTEACRTTFGVDLNLTKYGIKANPDHGLMGPEVTIFYSNELGLYPYFDEQGEAVNGGLPQLANLTAHLEKAERDIKTAIPSRSFSGLAVIDWESWRPVWDRNYDKLLIYQNKSESLVQEQHPSWNHSHVTQEASRQFQAAARELMKRTVSLGRKMRPGGRWGYYLFPNCYNYQDEPYCSEKVKTDNNRLSWLYETSSGLYPSAYLPRSGSSKGHSDYIKGQIQEAKRTRDKFSPRDPIYLYSKFQYRESSIFYTTVDLNNSIAQAKNEKLDGIILWGDHNSAKSKQACQQLKNYVDNVLGPFVKNLKNK